MASYPVSHPEKQGGGKRETERPLGAQGDLLELLRHGALRFPGYLWAARCSRQAVLGCPSQALAAPPGWRFICGSEMCRGTLHSGGGKQVNFYSIYFPHQPLT